MRQYEDDSLVVFVLLLIHEQGDRYHILAGLPLQLVQLQHTAARLPHFDTILGRRRLFSLIAFILAHSCYNQRLLLLLLLVQGRGLVGCC